MNSQPLTREAAILGGLDVRTTNGLEIGPLCSPLARRPEATVEYLDHIDSDGLRAKYHGDPNVAADEIVEVDHILDGRSLTQIVGGKRFDYVIASHVIEHVPNVLGWLREIEEILAPGGTLRLAIPDRRFTFDYLRRESELSDALTADFLESKAPSPIQIVDFVLNAREIPIDQAWAGTLDPELLDPSTVDSARNLARDAADNGGYHDVHCWVFTSGSFARLMAQCATLGLTRFGVRSFVNTQPMTLEFYVIAEVVEPAEAAASWERMAEEVDALGVAMPSDRRDQRRRLADLEQELRAANTHRAIIEGSGSYRLARQIGRPVRAIKKSPTLSKPLRAIRARRPVGR